MTAKPSPSPWDLKDVIAKGCTTPTIVDRNGHVLAELVIEESRPNETERANGQILGVADQLLDVVRLGQRMRDMQKAPKTRSLEQSNRMKEIENLFDSAVAAVLAKVA